MVKLDIKSKGGATISDLKQIIEYLCKKDEKLIGSCRELNLGLWVVKSEC